MVAPVLTPYVDANPCPRVEVFFPSFVAGTASVTVYRLAAGREFRVRGAVNAPTAGALTRIDFEAPFGVPVTYRAEQFNAAGLSLGFTESATLGDQYTPWSVQATNLLTNPGFEAGGSTVVVRTNWCRNPSFESDTSGWTMQNGAVPSRVTTQAHRGTASMQVVTPGSVTNEGAFVSPATVPGMAIGNPWCASLWVLAPAGATMEAIANTVGTGGTSPAVSFTGTGAWQFIAIPNAVAASTAPYVIVRTRSTAQAVTFFVDEVLIEVGVSSPGPFFDGSVQAVPDSDFSTRWQGTANTSASELTATAPASLTALDAVRTVARSSRWVADGAYSARVLALGASNDTFAEVQMAVTAGATYTLVATGHLEAAQTGTLSSRARAVFVTGIGVSQSSSFPNAPGTYEVRHTFTPASTGTALIRLYNGASVGGGDVWWDLAALVAGQYDGPAFTGATIAADPLTSRYTWLGGANASSSTFETRTYLGVGLMSADSWMHNPLSPSGAVRVIFGDDTAKTIVRPTPGEVSYPKGRMVGVVLAEPRRGVAGLQVTLRTSSDSDADRVQAMVGDQKTPPVVCIRLGGDDRRTRVPQPLFLSTLSVAEIDMNHRWGGSELAHQFEGDEVDPPIPGLFIPLLRRKDLNAFYATNAALNASGLTRADVNRQYNLAGYGG